MYSTDEDDRLVEEILVVERGANPASRGDTRKNSESNPLSSVGIFFLLCAEESLANAARFSILLDGLGSSPLMPFWFSVIVR